MVVYSVVDEGYEVEVFTSFDAVWKRVNFCDWMDRCESKALTSEALKAALKSESCAKLYETDAGGEWAVTVRKHTT